MSEQPQRPGFINRSGDIIKQPPFVQRDTRFYGFMLQGDIDKMQAVIDRELNAASGGEFNLKLLSDHLMLSIADIGWSCSNNPRDRERGGGSEIDSSIWLPVANIVERDGEQCFDQFFWYCPYVWVDSPIAMVNGRDLYGYPKTMGRFEMPPRHQPDHFSLSVDSFRHYGKHAEAEWNEVFKLDNLSAGETVLEQWDDVIDAFKGIFELAAGSLRYPPDAGARVKMLRSLLSAELPQIFLKQLPGAQADKAVYQALMSAPVQLTDFHRGGLLLGDYQLTLSKLDSIPLVQQLGLIDGAQDCAFSFWLDFDFELPAPKLLVDHSRVGAREKIAILGGGVAACTAAAALTEQPGWAERYDITLYQQGWRIGGKGASGRNAEVAQRIEEHGLHIWFGFYRNAFESIQKAYTELDRPEGVKLRHWHDAFKPHDFIVHMEHFHGKWTPWSLDFAVTGGDPGVGTESVSTWKLVRTAYAYLRQWLGDLRDAVKRADEQAEQTRAPRPVPQGFSQRLAQFGDWLEDEVEDFVDDADRLFNGLLAFVESLPEEFAEHSSAQQGFLKSILEDIKEWLEDEAREYLEDDAEVRHLFIGVDMATTVLLGMIRDDIFERGFDVINELDFRDWLRQHGANEAFTVQSSTVRALYDLIFAFEDGDIDRPNAEAGTLLRGMFRIGLCYNGSVMWKMQAGMGDTIFTPYYQLLKKRGVKFKYFHRVDELKLNTNNPRLVESIELTRQLELIDGADSYHPLVTVDTIGCWPSQPLFEQIAPAQAALLQEKNIDLECYWSDWDKVFQLQFGRPLPTVSLKRGRDFDIVINAIPIGCQPHIAAELLQQSPSLKKCCEQVKTVATQAYQLWTDPSLRELGWTDYGDDNDADSGQLRQAPVMTSWTEPVDTWAVMNQLLDKEDWSKTDCEPKNVAYFCGAFPAENYPSRHAHDFPVQCRQQVKHNCLQQMADEMHSLWPAAATAGEFNWDVLTSPRNLDGVERFDDQYWRANVSPSERYTLSVAGSSKFRIDTRVAELDNILFTGDWINTGLNAGCVEAATMAGLQTSRELSGHPRVIKGEHDFGDPEL